MLHATLSRPVLDDAFGARWQADALAWGASPFLSWAWVGCLAAERFPDPVLAEVHADGALLGRALFNRRRGPLGTSYHLHESGEPGQDGVFIEHNGPLAQPGRAPEVLHAMLVALGGTWSRTALSGVDDALLQAAGRVGLVLPLRTRMAPFARLDPDRPFGHALSRNTGAQLRRSDRSYAQTGPITVTAARTVDQARDWLAQLVAWHGATWQGRGIASGFLADPVQRFHRALLPRAVPAGVVQVQRVAAGGRGIGFLLNLEAAGRVCAYQSGFDYAGAAPHEKPGLTSHAAAAEDARRRGAGIYDFLAGDARYKRSLADEAQALHWIGWQRAGSWPGLTARARALLGR